MKKIFIACSKWNYQYIPEIKKALELMDYEVILPNYYENPMIEEDIKKNGLRKEELSRLFDKIIIFDKNEITKEEKDLF